LVLEGGWVLVDGAAAGKAVLTSSFVRSEEGSTLCGLIFIRTHQIAGLSAATTLFHERREDMPPFLKFSAILR
ncbi:MAG TPA: hypothetical protein VIG66_01355, partial [Noviherbaspirillum sp.]